MSEIARKLSGNTAILTQFANLADTSAEKSESLRAAHCLSTNTDPAGLSARLCCVASVFESIV